MWGLIKAWIVLNLLVIGFYTIMDFLWGSSISVLLGTLSTSLITLNLVFGAFVLFIKLGE